MSKNRNRSRAAEERLTNLKELAARAKIDAPNAFTEVVNCPQDLFLALQTGRPELIKHVKSRPLSEEEGAAVYHLVAVLIETNMALREHAQIVATMADQWRSMVKGSLDFVTQIDNFANFHHDQIDDEDVAA